MADPSEEAGRDEDLEPMVDGDGHVNEMGDEEREGTREGGGEAVTLGSDMKLVGVAGGACRWRRRRKFWNAKTILISARR